MQWEAREGIWGALVAGLWVWGITGSFGWHRRKATVPGSCFMMGAHCGVWGTAAQRRDPQKPFLCPPFHPHNWLLTGESCLPLMQLWKLPSLHLHVNLSFQVLWPAFWLSCSRLTLC